MKERKACQDHYRAHHIFSAERPQKALLPYSGQRPEKADNDLVWTRQIPF
jgi:hypothetical protein